MYLKLNQTTITDFSDNNINTLYNQGYLFTRVGKGIMNQTRSLRIDLSKFELSSENKRIIKKTDSLFLIPYSLPYTHYTWQIGKMAKDFYETKFGKGVFSANKIKELLTDKEKSNFNLLLTFNCHPELDSGSISYAICRETDELLHYSYPFYNLEQTSKDTGLGMMIRAIVWAKESGKKYVYLGSASRPTDTYKLQFKGVEWFDGKTWNIDLEKLKTTLSS